MYSLSSLKILLLFTLFSLCEHVSATAAFCESDNKPNAGDYIRKNGNSYLVYGTAWKEQNTATYVHQAIMNGFRFIDTANQPRHYNESGAGEGWTHAAKELGLKRENIHIQTKFTPIDGQDPNNIPYDKSADLTDQIKQSVEGSLVNLQTSYIDSLVLHSPLETLDRTKIAWQVLESFVKEGKVKKLGISNCYDFNYFEQLYNYAEIKPSVLQNRFYSDSNFDVKLREFCKVKGIAYQSFWTLTANRFALNTAVVKDLASKKGCTPQTLMYAYMMSLGHQPLCGTTSKEHMKQDMAVVSRIYNGEEILSQRDIALMSRILGVPDEAATLSKEK